MEGKINYMIKDKTNFIESVFLIIIVMICHTILDLPNTIITSVSSSAPLNVIYITILALIFFLIINKLFSPFETKDIIDIAEYVGGNILKKIISIVYTLHIIFISGIFILSFADTIKTIYLQDVPAWIICLVFILVAVIANLYGFNNISRVNYILMPFILLSVLVIFLALATDFVPQRIFPILGYGADKTFLSGIGNIFAFGEIILLFLIKPQLKDPKSSKKIGITSILISGLFLFLTVTTLLLLYPFSTGGKGVLSIYIMTRSIQFGKFFQRADALFILVWVLTFFSYLSVIINYVLRITQKNTGSKKNALYIYIIAIAIFIVTLIPKDIVQIRFAENVIYKYSTLIVVFVLSFVVILLGYLKKRKERGIVQISERNISNES